MKKIACFYVFLVLLLNSSVHAVSPSNYWVGCWISAVELSKNSYDYQDAIGAYTAAMKAQPVQQSPKYLCLYNERGRLYLKMQNFSNAIRDFSFVLNQKEASREDTIDALWGRGQAYLATGKHQEFENDRKRLDELEPFVIPLEENQDYMILKLGSHVWRDVQSRERFVKILLMQKKIKSKQDVIFTPSGIAIVKKT